MPVMESPAEAVYLEYQCDVPECDGRVNQSAKDGEPSIILTVDPPLYPQYCDTCGARHTLEYKYPTVTFRKQQQG